VVEAEWLVVEGGGKVRRIKGETIKNKTFPLEGT
jgi:hypothetical protein